MQIFGPYQTYFHFFSSPNILPVKFICLGYRLGGLVVKFSLSERVQVFELRSGQTKDLKIVICCFYAKPVALGS